MIPEMPKNSVFHNIFTGFIISFNFNGPACKHLVFVLPTPYSITNYHNYIPIDPIFFVCLTSFFVFRIADLPHSPGVVHYHLLLRRETRIPGVALFSF